MADRKPVEIMDLASIQAVSDPQISPDGGRAVFAHTVMDFEKDEYLSDLWMAELDTGKVYQYTSGRRKDKNPLWSPYGGRILFTSTPPPGKNGEKKKTQLYVIDVSGGEARQLTDVESGVDSPRWAPNGKSILFLSNVKRVDRGDSDVKVIDRLVYKFNGRGFFENLRKHLFTVPAKGGKVRQVTKGEFDVSNAEWMSDSKGIVFASNLDPDADIVRQSYLYKVDAKGGDPVQLTRTLMSIGGVKGVEIGSGFQATTMKGSEHNDEWVFSDGEFSTRTNRCGGILGGISTGGEIIARIAVKPTSTIGRIQKTVATDGREVTISPGGRDAASRHDPCLCPRVVPVAEAMTALVLADHLIRHSAGAIAGGMAEEDSSGD